MTGTRPLAWIGSGIGGALAAAVLWLIVNYCWTVNGAGLLERHGWPLSKIYLAAAAGALLGSVGGLISQRRQARYARDLAVISASMHFALRPDVCREEMKEYENLPPIKKWSSARHRMTGRVAGLDVEMLDLTYADKGSDSDTYYHQTILLVSAPEGAFPAFELRPRDMTVKVLGKMLGLQGITFSPTGASATDAAVIEQFSRMYYLSTGLEADIRKLHDQVSGHKSGDENRQQAIRNVFTLKVLRFLAEHARWRVESDGKHLALWRNVTMVRPADRPTFVSEALQLRAALAQPLAFASDLPAVSTQTARDLVKLRARILGTVAGTFLGFAAGCAVGMADFFSRVPFQPQSGGVLLSGLGFFGLSLLGVIVGACVGNRLLYYPVLYFLRRQPPLPTGAPPRPYQQPRTSNALLEHHGRADLTITCPPAGIWRGNSKFLLFGCVAWNAFVIPFTVLFLPAAFRGEVMQEGTNEPASPLFALVLLTPFWLFGIGSVLALLHNGKRWARLSVRGGQLDVDMHGLFRTTHYHLSRTEVREVRAGGNLEDDCGKEELCIEPRRGPPVRLLGYRGKKEIAWMAQTVRRALGLDQDDGSLTQSRGLSQ
jgi:hypothetical protein